MYCVKNVTVVPLSEVRARAALSKLSTLHAHHEEPPPVASFADAVDSSIPPLEEEDSSATTASSPKVKFAAEDQIKMMTPKATDGFDLPPDDEESPSSPSSVVSTPSSEYSVNTGNIAKVLTDKLSFWSRLSKTLLCCFVDFKKVFDTIPRDGL